MKGMKLFEKLIITLIIVIFVLGVVFDYTQFDLFQLEDYDGYAFVVLQIQATLATLGLSIITILSNAFKQEEYGVSVSDFIMNRSNKLLTQKRVIIISLLLIMLSLFEYVREHLNVVCSLLGVEVCLLLYLLNNVTMIFRAYTEIRERIFNQEVKDSKNGKGFSGFFDAFVIMDDITESKAKDYVEKAELLIDSYLPDKEKFRIIAEGISRMVSKLLYSNNKNNADLGVRLLYHYYLKYNEFNLFGSEGFSYGVYASSLRAIVDGYKNTTRLFNLYKGIPFAILGKQIKAYQTGVDVRDSIAIAGYYAWKCCREGDEYLKQQISFFVPDITDRMYLGLREDSEHGQLIEKAAADYYLGFANELIKAGKARILSDYCFRQTFSGLMRRDSICRYYVLGMVVLCLYYSVFEEDDLVSESIRESCSYLLATHWNGIRTFLVRCIYGGELKANDVLAVRELLHDRESIQDGKAKFLIMDGVVNKSMIILFVLCDRINVGHFGQFIEKLFSIDGDYNYRLFIEHPESMKEQIGSVFKVLDNSFSSLDDEKKDSEVSRIYSVIDGAIRKELFKSIMSNSKKTLESVESFEEVCKRICNGFEEHVKKTTAQFCVGLTGITEDDSSEVTIPDISIPVGSLIQEDIVTYLYNTIDSWICYGILNALRSHLDESEVKCDDESEVEKLIDTISEYDNVVGSGSFFIRNYMLQKKIDELIEARKNFIISDNDSVLALFNSNAVSIDFSDFSAEIQEFSDEEIKAREEKLGDQYIVNVINNITLAFGEENLLEYYHLNKRKLLLKCKMKVRFLAEKVGKLVRIIES